MMCRITMVLVTASLISAAQATTSKACHANVANDQLLLQTASHRHQASVNKHAANRTSCVVRPDSHQCCGQCAERGGFCSPNSLKCYDAKKKSYYETCCESNATSTEEAQPTCCSACAGKAYCSPGSGSCYDLKKKDYYLSCGGKPAVPQCCTDCAGKLGFYSPSSGNCYKVKLKEYYQACTAVDSADSQTGECKVGGDNWCAAAVPDSNFSLKTCPNLGMRIKAITYNLFWWNLFGQRGGNRGSAGKLVKGAAGDEPFDFAGFQECDDPNWIMGDAGMSRDDYDYVRWGSNTLAFNKRRFEKLASGEDKFAQDFGRFNYQRGAHWARLQERATGKSIFVMNHHGPLPVNTGGICGGEATAYNMLNLIERHSEPSDALLFMGDFNADDGSQTVQTLKGYMQHVMNDWVDNFFSNCGGHAVKETQNLGSGGSDHNALMTIIEY